ncbi:MAG: hypothetical protein V9E82_15060 [Candidatus Nanopelagicales bacterium]
MSSPSRSSGGPTTYASSPARNVVSLRGKCSNPSSRVNAITRARIGRSNIDIPASPPSARTVRRPAMNGSWSTAKVAMTRSPRAAATNQGADTADTLRTWWKCRRCSSIAPSRRSNTRMTTGSSGV